MLVIVVVTVVAVVVVASDYGDTCGVKLHGYVDRVDRGSDDGDNCMNTCPETTWIIKEDNSDSL